MSRRHERHKSVRKTREATRVRSNGTRVTNTALAPNPGQARIDALRQIVAQPAYAIIDGVSVDLFTASAVVSVHDALSEPNRAKFISLPLLTMVSITWKLIK